jgi:uncharacterized membrane protein
MIPVEARVPELIKLRHPGTEALPALVHLYRGEMQRANAWRMRLDTTTNWAVVTTGAMISFSLADPAHTHAVIVLTMLLVTLFLWVEARRYRYFELWNLRVRLMEHGYFAPLLEGRNPETGDWAANVAASLRAPDFPVTMRVAFAWRYRRNYVWLFLILALAWITKALLHPVTAHSLADFVDRWTVGPIPGVAVVGFAIAYNVGLAIVGLTPAHLRRTSEEVLAESPGAAGPATQT